MNRITDISKPVKLLHPEKGEEELVFKVTNYNDVTGRCYIKPVDSHLPFEGEELVDIRDIVNV